LSELGARLREMIATDGPMPVEQFMMLALSHPTLGYYATRDPLGSDGDFTTSPEISQMFGELLGLWAAETWMAMGSPSPVLLVELGPGRGTLMADALRAARVCPPFLEALDVHLVETSPTLRERQQALLGNAGVPVRWHTDLEALPDGPAIFLANEFFDALPVRQYVRTPAGWCERLVGLDAARQLCFGVAPAPEPHLSTPAPVGAMLEIGALAYRTTMEIAARIVREGGAALVIDYGHTQSGLGETLQALSRHQRVDPLDHPGEADLTTHVDFAALARAARAAGAQVAGPVRQADFLSRIGIFERAASLRKSASPQQAQDIDSALIRLVSTEPEAGAGDAPVPGMGELFKVMAIVQPGLPVVQGFDAGAEP
jgi:NADH dehydrogenase [ubiquinone] 1 alpha subcomplex assembly factor 7